MTNHFFKPFVGDNYHQGINGKKVLVVGASFYCANKNCENFSECTSDSRKDSSKFNRSCPQYCNEGKSLCQEPTYNIEGAYRTYQTFTNTLVDFVGTNDYHKIWSRMAFTNYIQYFLGHTDTQKTNLSERDFNAFMETLEELKPDVVIIWGGVINSRLKEENQYVVNKAELTATNYYVCHMQMPSSNHEITIINPDHPSAPAFHTNKAEYLKHLKSVLG